MGTETLILNRKLDMLRAKYLTNMRLMENIKNDHEQKVNAELEKMRQDIRTQVSEHDEALKNEYQTAYENYTQNVDRMLDNGIETLNQEYMKLKSENEKMLSEMEAVETEISDSLNDLKSDLAEKETLKKNEASSRLEKAYNSFDELTRCYPHDFFEPNAANALLMQLESAKVDFNAGFYEACMANASNIEFQTARMKDRINNDLNIWKRLYQKLENYEIILSEMIGSKEFSIIQNDSFEKELYAEAEKESDTFDFWSEGKYSELSDKIRKYDNMIRAVHSSEGNSSDEKLSNYLRNERKKGNLITVEKLAHDTENISHMNSEACRLMSYIHTGFEASVTRALKTAPAIISYLKDRGADIIKSGFKDKDIRKEYIIFAEETSKEIYISVFPVSPDKKTVVNTIGIYIRHTGNGTPETLKASENSVLSGIREISEGVTIISESSSSENSSDTEHILGEIQIKAAEKRKKELSSRRMVR